MLVCDVCGSLLISFNGKWICPTLGYETQFDKVRTPTCRQTKIKDKRLGLNRRSGEDGESQQSVKLPPLGA